MSELVEKLRNDFQNEEYRHSYAEECLNTMIATQIKVLREQRKMTQGTLAEKSDMKQPRIPVLEDANYANWSINTLKRLARAFDVALSVRFDAFSDVVLDFEYMSRESLQRPSFSDDPLFRNRNVRTSRAFRRHRRERSTNAAQADQMNLFNKPARVVILQSPNAEAATRPPEGGRNAISIGAAG